jgi:hypothetical protein
MVDLLLDLRIGMQFRLWKKALNAPQRSATIRPRDRESLYHAPHSRLKKIQICLLYLHDHQRNRFKEICVLKLEVARAYCLREWSFGLKWGQATIPSMMEGRIRGRAFPR